MNEQDKALLKKLQNNPNNYEVIVDNDSIGVEKVNPYDQDEQETLYESFDCEYESFSTFGESFIVELLQELGFNADYC